MRAAIISYGCLEDLEFHRRLLQQCELIICADGGAIYARRMGIVPHAIVGDFDSGCRDLVESFPGVEVLEYPVAKDKTDTELAVDYAVEKGAKHILLLGSTGSRLDHTIANIGLLKTMLDMDVEGEVINEKNRAFLIREQAQVKGKGAYVSLIPFGGDVTGVSLKGFKYPLEDATLKFGSSLGISNLLEGETGEVTLKKGLLLVIVAWD